MIKKKFKKIKVNNFILLCFNFENNTKSFANKKFSLPENII